MAGADRLPEGSGCGPGRRGCGGWDQPGRAETGKEGCLARLKVPEVPEAKSRAVRRLYGAVCLQGCRSSAESFAQGGFSHWLPYLNGTEDRL